MEKDTPIVVSNDTETKSYFDKRSKYYWFVGFWSIKARGEDTGQAYSLLQGIIPQGIGTPLHIHSKEEEAFFIQEGVFLFQYGNKMVSTNPGDYLYLKRGLPHKFKNIGNTTG
ncbi:MAG: cupin domain-containing protein, partial [Thermoproteota archaeon]|nr:cupin domain-containing protein [Thermoproteota archaeon]